MSRPLFAIGGSALDKGLDAFQARAWRRARVLLQKATMDDDRAAAPYHLGLLFWRGLGGARDVDAAVHCFARAADKGHAAAQTAYGLALRSGVGAAKDAEAARALFRSAAGAGDVEALTQLGVMSEPGEARRLFTRAAERGHPPAMRYLAELVMTRDPVEALAWLYAAAALTGDDRARKRARALAREMSADEIAEAQKAGRAYAKNIARKGKS